jgi:hypothetical protein
MFAFIPNNYFHLSEQKKNGVRTYEMDEREGAVVLCLGCKSQPSG